MVDRETEWDKQGYRENGGKMNWILEKGLTLGKRILITGFVVSSVPVVLPPLVVISAIGFACSVPYGFFLASYVCTERLMNKLLPIPVPSPELLENGIKDGYDDYEEQEEREDTWFGGDVSAEEDQEELLEHTNGSVEASIEPIKKDKEEVNFLGDDVHPLRSSEKENVDEIVEENGYAENHGELVEEEEERPLKGTELRTGVRAEEENELLVEESGDGVQKLSAVMISLGRDKECGNKFKEDEGPFETSMLAEMCQGRDNENGNKLVSETTRLREDIRDDMISENGVKDDEQCAQIFHEDAREGDQKGKGNIKRIGMLLGNRNVRGSVSRKGPISVIEEKAEENDKEIANVQQSEDIGSLPDKKNVNSIINNGHKYETDRPAMLPGGKRGDQTSDAAKGDLPTNRAQEIAISSSLDAKAIADGSGFEFHAEYGASEGGKQANYSVCKVIESSKVIVPLRVDDSIAAEVPSQKDVSMASDQVLYNEQDMRKQIAALRAIVGYSAVPQKTCVEELRALYIVTGIEPPTSFKEPCDLVEVNDKLRFLMAVVGVKGDT